MITLTQDNIYILKFDSLNEANEKYFFVKNRFEQHEYQKLIIDINNIDHVNHKFILQLIKYAKLMMAVKGKMVLVDSKQRLSQLLDMMKLNHYFEVVNNEKEAILYTKKS